MRNEKEVKRLLKSKSDKDGHLARAYKTLKGINPQEPIVPCFNDILCYALQIRNASHVSDIVLAAAYAFPMERSELVQASQYILNHFDRDERTLEFEQGVIVGLFKAGSIVGELTLVEENLMSFDKEFMSLLASTLEAESFGLNEAVTEALVGELSNAIGAYINSACIFHRSRWREMRRFITRMETIEKKVRLEPNSFSYLLLDKMSVKASVWMALEWRLRSQAWVFRQLGEQ